MRPTGKKVKQTAKTAPQRGGRSFVGIDVSDHSVKIVQISGRSVDHVRVENCVIAPLPQGAVTDGKVTNENDLVVTLQQLSARVSGLGKNVVTCVPSLQSTLQNLAYDAGSGMDMESAAEFEAAQVAVLDDINFDFVAQGKGPDGEDNLVIALAKKEDIEARVDAFASAGLEVAFMDIEDIARANAFSYWVNTQSLDLEDSLIAVFDIGEKQTKAQIMQGGTVLFRQDFSAGGVGLTREIQRTYQMSLEEAEHLKVSQNKPADYRSVAEVFQTQVAQEIGRTLQFFYTSAAGSRQKVERIFLTGGGSQTEGLADMVIAQTSIPTQALHPLASVTASGKINQEQFKQNAARFTVAFGLALRGLL